MSNTLPLPVLEMGPAACLTSIGQPMPQQAASDGFEAALSSAKPGAGKAKTPPSQPDQPEPGGQPSADDTTDPKAAEQQAAPQASLSEPAGQSLPPEPPGTSSEPAKEVRPASVRSSRSRRWPRRPTGRHGRPKRWHLCRCRNTRRPHRRRTGPWSSATLGIGYCRARQNLL